MRIDVVQTLCDLVRIPSVNPMGRDVSGPEYYEQGMTAYLENLFTRHGLLYERQEVHPGRCNILARLDGEPRLDQGGPLLVLEAHQDTVPVDGMTIPPWDPQCRDGRIYGRGACDIKGGMAAMLSAFLRIAELKAADRPTLVMACSVNEELGSSGAKHMSRAWGTGGSRVVPRPPDAVVVAEPTLLDVVVAHKGVLRWRCRTRGRAAHSSSPAQGENAIYHMARVIAELELYARQEVQQLGEHPLLGGPTLSVGRISGGISVNTVPDECVIEIDRRLLPGEDPAAAQRHVMEFLARRLGSSVPVEHEAPFTANPGLADRDNRQLAERLASVVQDGGWTGGRLIGVPYGTDAPSLAAAGIPTVVFGPGSIAQAHTCDEWLAIEQLEAAAEILYRFARQFAAAT